MVPLIEALIWVESRGKSEAVNSVTGAGGLFQILPDSGYIDAKVRKHYGYLTEANRILKRKAYTDADRFDPIKSREIFEIVNGHRNPKRSIQRAIKLHNPRAGAEYSEAIYERMKKQ